MIGHDDFVLSALVEEGLVTREAVDQARKHAVESDRSPSEALVAMKMADARTIVQDVRRTQAPRLWFKATVTAAKQRGIHCAENRSDKTQLYEVVPRAKEVAELRESAEAFA